MESAQTVRPVDGGGEVLVSAPFRVVLTAVLTVVLFHAAANRPRLRPRVVIVAEIERGGRQRVRNGEDSACAGQPQWSFINNRGFWWVVSVLKGGLDVLVDEHVGWVVAPIGGQ